MKPTDSNFDGVGKQLFESRRFSPFPKPAFSALLDTTFDRLEDQRNQGFLKRIQRLSEILETLEGELDRIIGE